MIEIADVKICFEFYFTVAFQWKIKINWIVKNSVYD